MSRDQFMRIHSPEFVAMSERVIEAMTLTSRLNALPFEDELGKVGLLTQILGRPLPERTTICPGVTIGKDSVVAAGAVVADDVPPSSIVASPKATIKRQWDA